MESKMHIIDPDGEVIIILRNPDAFVAEWIDHSDDASEPAELDPEPEPGPESEPVPVPVPAAEAEPEIGSSETTAHSSEVTDPDTNNYDNNSETSHRFQVSMKHLALASPVFKKILTGDWKEGATLAQKGSVEIIVEGWDSEALLILLQAIHCQHNLLPKEITLEMLAKIAVLADYYQCADVLGFCTSVWIQALKEPPTTICRDLLLWLWISFALRLPDQFEKFTSTVMSINTGRIDCLGLPIPLSLFRTMNTRREDSIGQILALLYKTQADLLNGRRGCNLKCRSTMYGYLTLQMHSGGLLSPHLKPPYRKLSYQQLVQQISKFASPQWDRQMYHDYNCNGHSFTVLLGRLSDTVSGIQGIEESRGKFRP